ncbi:histidine utilization repressor [Vibrio sp. ZSDZ34]|jgi:GntR family histidine utilization transcriptional repressor|uniref:Histidine utilization repressor n=1 Tax=Vibrio gelatinilyticus TaxID=2893468 RepID=A0A9X1W9E2_9VIBR|nr:histidine utilization repressor [Vibrio gelatinilyticus]MCJ2376186.1 histidine utilization repressor [Vibrio gelatinilyticus]
MDTTKSVEPLYIQIKQFIESNIDSGRWSIGHRITTEIELAKQFSVSRMTVNKAIRDLVSDGKLVRKPRLGTFVRLPDDKVESPLHDTRNIAEEVRTRGKQHSSIVVKHDAINADEYIATKLGIMLGSPIFYSEIIHKEDGTPIQLECRWVNAHYAPNYHQQDFTQTTPNEYLSKNCPLTAIEHTVEAIQCKEEIARQLNITPQEPCLLLSRRTWSDSKLISTALLYHPGSRYKLSSKIDIQ